MRHFLRATLAQGSLSSGVITGTAACALVARTGTT
jgi:hypothetical protein